MLRAWQTAAHRRPKTSRLSSFPLRKSAQSIARGEAKLAVDRAIRDHMIRSILAAPSPPTHAQIADAANLERGQISSIKSHDQYGLATVHQDGVTRRYVDVINLPLGLMNDQLADAWARSAILERRIPPVTDAELWMWKDGEVLWRWEPTPNCESWVACDGR